MCAKQQSPKMYEETIERSDGEVKKFYNNI